jgi:PIN domain nuclease of toxin-antitoxin system
LLADNRLSSAAQDTFSEAAKQGRVIGVPAICLIEVIYLAEKGNIPAQALTKLIQELQTPGSVLAIVPLDQEIALAIQKVPRTQVPDMPDRIIAANALHLDLPLVARDRAIQNAELKTVWKRDNFHTLFITLHPNLMILVSQEFIKRALSIFSRQRSFSFHHHKLIKPPGQNEGASTHFIDLRTSPPGRPRPLPPGKSTNCQMPVEKGGLNCMPF